MANNPLLISLYLLIYSSSSLLFCHALNNITKGQVLKDGQTLVSIDENFELGFFSAGNSSLRYVGIRYHKIQDQAVIWVANRGRPISDRDGMLTIGEDGNLIIKDGNLNSVWSSNVEVKSKNPVAALDVTGNLILSSNDGGGSNKTYWQSFNHPTDTNLPNMKTFVSPIPGENRAFTSWKSEDDPSPGRFQMGIDTVGMPQIVIWESLGRRWRSGPWNAKMFTGVPTASGVIHREYGFKLFREADGNLYFIYVPLNASDLIRIRLSWDGYGEQLKWNVSQKKWVLMQKQPANACDYYNHCGNFGVCSETDPKKCSCIDGFQPRNLDQWNKGIWADGCERKSPLKCHQRNSSVAGESSGAGAFRELKYMKLPDFGDVETAATSYESCRQMCLDSQSCNAFANVSGIGCLTWTRALTDVQKFNTVGNSLYLKQSLGECKSDTLAGEKRNLNLIICIPVIVGSVIMAIWAFFIWKWMRAQRERKMKKWEIILSQRAGSGFLDGNVHGETMSQVKLEEVPLFSLQELAIATDNFNMSNKLGQGGFGPVYMGRLPSGQEIAVKRLSTASGQGLEEFINEVIVISKLQHRNLVRLLGCCVDGDEKLLVYEYMPNKSLDALLFDPINRELLSWEKRLSIVEGICRGLIYLHRDSRLRIIHRDMKASNILLDEGLNPKISDFGMARIFGGNEEQANTMRVVGTYGYMSPEYAMEGRFSEKSDVYSFGVLLLEIVSGRRNNSFYGNEQTRSLLGFAWKSWNEGNIAGIIDPSISDPCFREEIFRCIHVGLLCVQELAKDRPAMSTVISMLNNEIVDLPTPKQPAFSERQIFLDTDESVQPSPTAFSVNNVTITVVTGR